MIARYAILIVTVHSAFSQGGRGGANPLDSIPNLSAPQRDALTRANAELAPQLGAITVARNALAAAVFAEPRTPAAIPIMASAVREAELAFAMARAAALTRIQLSPAQIAAWTAGGGGGRGGRGGALYMTQRQTAALAQINTEVSALVQAAAAARAPCSPPPRRRCPRRPMP